MLKRLKWKFILASLGAVALVICIIIGIINIFNYQSVVFNADDTLKLLMENSGKFPNKPEDEPPDWDITITPETPYESRHFHVVFRKDRLIYVNTDNIAAIDDIDAVKMAKSVINKNENRGFYDIYRYYIYEKDDKTTVIFLNCARALDNAKTFFLVSIIVSLIGLLIVFLLLWLFAERIVKPMSDGYEKQKQFITNAGHDIKTPLTIIDADAELLEMEVGDNEWLKDIKKQTTRLASLTGDLIYLSRMEEPEAVAHSDFPISDVLDEVVMSFAAPAKTKSVSINSSIWPAIYYHGDQEAIRKLFTLLLDNAIKYSPEGGEVKISLKKSGRALMVKISNEAKDLSTDTVKHMFDRFYRSDKARTSAGGFGIGLSVADAIVGSHKGRISAEKQGEDLVIEIIL